MDNPRMSHDGSCHIQKGKTFMGAGVYHPSSANSNLVEPNDTGLTNNIGTPSLSESRNGSYGCCTYTCSAHVHIASDSLTSLHQIRKWLL